MAAVPLLAVLASLLADTSGNRGAPIYSAESIANSAANVAAFYAANTFVTIYGQNLAYTTKEISLDDVRGQNLPTVLTGTGVRVLINQIPANIWYVSPMQVNLLIPPSLTAGPATVQLVVDGLAGPAITIALNSSAPALFQWDASTVVATHGNWPPITVSSPAKAGEVIVLYASGLGPTLPRAVPNQAPQGPAPLEHISDFRVLLNGVPVDSRRIEYAGATPGYAGLFQINLRLPEDAPPNPEIRVGYGDRLSPAQRYLPLQ
ncbi:MAG: hypothetical protein DMG59_16345 [Acidobacteria bacterium]|nr:MAG: hypothetical protein DMG59_16345 [Acidobacteriota bacterium]